MIVLETDMDERQVTRNQSMAKMLITWQAMSDAADSYTGQRRSVSGLVGGDGSRIGKNVIEICRAADISFLALHGEDGENGKVQATFDMFGIRYTGSGYLGSALAMNKELSKVLFRHSGIPTPAGIVLEKGAESYEDVGFPCVVKPCSGGPSVGTSIVYSRDEYDAALEFAFRFEARVLVERYIKDLHQITILLLMVKEYQLKNLPKSFDH